LPARNLPHRKHGLPVLNLFTPVIDFAGDLRFSGREALVMPDNGGIVYLPLDKIWDGSKRGTGLTFERVETEFSVAGIR